MKNELLEEYIKDNNLQIFEKNYVSDLIIQLKDTDNEMMLCQVFNYVSVTIDGEFFHTFEKKKGLDRRDYWFVIK